MRDVAYAANAKFSSAFKCFPPFNGPMERRLAIYTTRTLSKPLHPMGLLVYLSYPNVYSCQLVIHVAFLRHIKLLFAMSSSHRHA